MSIDPGASRQTQEQERPGPGRADSTLRAEPGTKREKRIAAREDRKRRAASAQKTARIRKMIAIVVGLIVIAALIIILVTSGVFTSLLTPSVGQTVPIEAADHVPENSQITWNSRPPSSGPHYPVWSQKYGVLEEGLSPGYWVHNLEHGAVAILYNCPEGCPEIVQQLKDLYPTLPKGRNSRGGMPRVIIVPYTDMDSKIAAVAWGWLLPLDSVDADKITRFVDARMDRGPECVNLVCP
jgi:hypothetical protein